MNRINTHIRELMGIKPNYFSMIKNGRPIPYSVALKAKTVFGGQVEDYKGKSFDTILTAYKQHINPNIIKLRG